MSELYKEDILPPLVRYLREDPGLKEMQTLIPDGGYNPILGPPIQVPRNGALEDYQDPYSMWIFRGFNQSGAPFANIEGTGSSSITLEHSGSWTTAPAGRSGMYPEIRVYYHCDPTRDASMGNPIQYDARDKCLSLHHQVSRLLHINQKPVGGYLLMGVREDGSGALRVSTAKRGRELFLREVPNGDGLIEGQASFNLEILY